MQWGPSLQRRWHPAKAPPRALPGECFPQCSAVKPNKKSQKSYSPEHCCNCCLKLPKWNKPRKAFLLPFVAAWQHGGCCSSKLPGPVSSGAERVLPICAHKHPYGTHTCAWLAAHSSTNTHPAHTKPQTAPVSSSCFFPWQLRVKVSEWDISPSWELCLQHSNSCCPQLPSGMDHVKGGTDNMWQGTGLLWHSWSFWGGTGGLGWVSNTLLSCPTSDPQWKPQQLPVVEISLWWGCAQRNARTLDLSLVKKNKDC